MPTAPLLVVGPSLGTSVEALWRPVVEHLGDDFDVVGWDLPGHGHSAPATAPFTVADLAAAVRDIGTELVIGAPRGRLYYAGVSVAGAVALELAVAPGQFAATACIAGAARLGDPELWRQRVELVRTGGTSALVDGSRQRWFAPGFVDRDPVTADRLLQSLTDTDDASYARCCEALAGFDLRPRLGEAQVPVLVLAGEHDVVVPPDAAQQVADALPNAQFATLAGCAHLPAAEDPAAVAEMLRTRLTEAMARG